MPYLFARKRTILACSLAMLLATLPTAQPVAQTAAPVTSDRPNYDLAAQWTAQKVGRLVFDTSVTPRWLETGDRFWYSYQTRDGRRFYLVDPIKKAKAPLFDHAAMAATLTAITRMPDDAQHLPFTTVKFVKNDTAFQFDVQVPRDAEVAKPKRSTTDDANAVAQSARELCSGRGRQRRADCHRDVARDLAGRAVDRQR